MSHRVKSYTVTYPGEAPKTQDFNETQLWAFTQSAVVEPDGVPIQWARAMVDSWNKIAKQQGRGAVYSIALVHTEQDPYKVAKLGEFAEKMVCLSTGLIPKHTAEALGNAGRDSCDKAPLWNVISYEPWADYGWIIWAHDPEALEGHPELAKLMRMCTAQGYDYLRLDCDARPHPLLPTFEW